MVVRTVERVGRLIFDERRDELSTVYPMTTRVIYRVPIHIEIRYVDSK
jgi:hypothetical protein